MKTKSIRFRIITRLAVVLTAVAIVANAGLFVYLRGELVEQYDDALQTQARAVAAVWQLVGNTDDASAAIAKALPDLHFGRASGDYLRIVRADGSTVLQMPSSQGPELWRDNTQPIRAHHEIYNLTLPNGKSGRAVEIGVGEGGATSADQKPRPPHFALVLAEDRREMDGTLTSFAIWLFAIGGGLSAAMIWLVLGIVRKELTPLGEFSNAVGRLDADSLSYRFPTADLADELAPVSERLNDLLQRLESAFDRERRFTGNVAHELRTPLAELRSMVEVAMRWPPDPAELRRHHGHVLEVVQRMSTVTQTLLTLVRSESARLCATMVPIDLIPLIKSAVLPHDRNAADRQVRFCFVLPDSLVIRADAAILSSLLDNLLSNASLYATAGSQIDCEVSTSPDGSSAMLRLTNAVTDLVSEDLVRLAEPFWRKDPARSPSDHAGLGLALVSTYAAAMRVDVSYAMNRPNHLTVQVLIPLAVD